MALSDHEEHQLQQIAAQFYADDPALATTLATNPAGAVVDRLQASLGVLAVLAGLGLMILSVSQDWTALGVLAFVMMLAGVVRVRLAVRVGVPTPTFIGPGAGRRS